MDHLGEVLRWGRGGGRQEPGLDRLHGSAPAAGRGRPALTVSMSSMCGVAISSAATKRTESSASAYVLAGPRTGTEPRSDAKGLLRDGGLG